MQKGMTSNFTNESEYQTLLEEAFFTKPEEIVFALSIGTDYTTALNRAKEIPIKPPYVEITTVDLIYFGLCATVHLEILRAYMVEKGEISEDSIDSEFFGLIWVKVKLSFCDYRTLKYIGTIHLRRWQIFTIFDPYLPSFLQQFFTTICWQIQQMFEPSPPTKCRHLKWMVPYIFIFAM